jgi:hypothetical protein
LLVLAITLVDMRACICGEELERKSKYPVISMNLIPGFVWNDQPVGHSGRF